MGIRPLAGPPDAPRAHPGDYGRQLSAQVQPGQGQGETGIDIIGPPTLRVGQEDLVDSVLPDAIIMI